MNRWLNPGSILRDWLNARDLRRWQRAAHLPPTVHRTYWSAYEYQRDLGRLQANGYRVSEERNNRSDPSATVDVAAPYFDKGYAYSVAAGRFGARLRHLPVTYRVSYERLSTATWARTVEAAQRALQ